MELLTKSGWILSETALKSIDSNANSKTIISSLLNRDLREIGAGIGELHKGKLENIDHELAVLQILKIRNISAPKANESSKTAPKLLKLTLTDGQNAYSAIEMEPTALSLEKTPPGTKISLKVKQLKFANSQLLLTPKNMEILGGNVEALVSKWEISRSLANQMKENRSGGAPPFTPFGQKIQQNVTNDKNFKSLQQTKQKENDENSEFNAQRQDAIAEASRAATRKTFGGGQKTLVDTNVQKVMDKGYSEEQAVTALKFARNNAEKALSNLKRREERQQRGPSNEYEPRESNENRRYEKRGSSGKGVASSDPPIAKPSTGVSLFDFLEKKIPESTATTAKTSSNYGHHNERFENNISSSFRKFDKDNSNKSQWSQQYSSDAMSSEQKSSQKYNNKSSYNSRNDYHESSSREFRGERSERGGERSERSEKGGDRSERRGDRSERGTDHYRGSNYRGGEKHSYYQQQQQASSGSNYSSKPQNNNTGSMSSSTSQYNRNAATSNQKPSNVNNGQIPYNSSSRNTDKGKYGQKPDYDSRSSNKDYGNSNKNYSGNNKDYGTSKKDYGNTNKDYGNSSYTQSASSYNSKSKSNSAVETYQSKSNPRNISESMEKMSLKGNNQHQSYKSYDSYNSNESKNYSSKYMPAGFQSKEANDQAKTALKTKNIPTAPKVSNWQQAPPQHPPSIPTPTSAPPQSVPIQHPIQVPVITQSAIKTGPPPFAQAAPQMHPFPVMAMPAQPAVYHAYQAAPIIMQSVPPPLQQPPGMHQLKIGDSCLAKYWEDGKFYNAKITGVSDSTYVVHFIEYGNAEEVRKIDCVPAIVPTCPTPPQGNFGPPPQIQMGGYPTQKMHQQQQHSYHNQSQSMAYKGGPKRRN